MEGFCTTTVRRDQPSARVVRAYNELRGTAKNSDFTTDDFPVGKFAELFGQLKQLDGWLEPIDKHRSRDLPRPTSSTRYAR
jgi:hypothetical protein